jgi:hypothetical protein
MENKPVDTFKEKPKMKSAWWTMGLGLAAIFGSSIALCIFNSAIRPMIDEAFNNKNAGGTVGFVVGILALALSISALVTGFCAFKKDERSWVLWLGFVPAVLVFVFWVFIFIGEFLFFE